MAIPHRLMRTIVVGVLSVLLLVACGDDDSADDTEPATDAGALDAALPDWLREVYPSPGANASERAVEIDYGVLEPRRELRIVIDGIDVTAQLDGLERTSDGRVLFPSPGSLRYDPVSLARPLVELAPGDHEAVVRLVELPEFGDRLREIDEFAWSFVMQ